ncbi:MAG TPA: hypothetical protein P5267_00235, partial [Patescibacteria group bacterium]|nr:hypothetical protein [Patescibacteria group bacterium]
MKKINLEKKIKQAETGIRKYLDEALKEGRIDEALFEKARVTAVENLKQWLNDKNIDKISPQAKTGICLAINGKQWEQLVNAFRQKMTFGTGGIRGLMAYDKAAIIKLKKEGIDAPILKGPNTLNNIVLLTVSAGVAKFGIDKGFKKIVIGYDSRIRGFDFAKKIAELFLGYGYTVYLFDEPCPYPEVTFAIPYKDIKAQLGILISASHNDYRYNGYKLSCGNGSQFDPEERDEMYNKYINEATTDDVARQLMPLQKAPREKLIFLGGEKRVRGFYYGNHKLIDIHKEHREHIKGFLIFNRQESKAGNLQIGYCAYHGAGRVAVPRLLKETGFEKIRVINENNLSKLDGLFPSFNSAPGKEQQPDPGDPRAAEVAVRAFKKEYGQEWDKLDILIGTDPDADRCG